MSLTDPQLALWLKSEGLIADATSASNDARYGDDAPDVQVVSGYATVTGAQNEADRQLALMGQALAIDVVEVAGVQMDREGETVTLVGDRLGYAGGRTALIIGIDQVDLLAEVTRLVVLVVMDG